MVKETSSTTEKTSRSKRAKAEAAVGQPDKLTCIEEICDAIDKARQRREAFKAELAAATSLVKTLESRRDTLIKLGPDALKEQQPLFGGDEKSNGQAAKNGKAKAEKPAKGKGNLATSWRSRPVKDAIAIGAVVNQLEVWDPPIQNLGELTLWLKNHKFQDLPGVSADKAGEAIDQYEEFFKANPHYVR